MAANNNENGNASNVENNNTQKVIKMKAPKNATEFIAGFVDGTIGENRKHNRWSTYWWGGLIVLEYTVPEDVIVNVWKNTRTVVPARHEIVAYRLQDGSVIYNANVLNYAGRKMAWGHRVQQWGQNDIQILIEKLGGAPLPFSLFTETGMDARDFAWVVRPVAETVTIKYTEIQYRSDDKKAYQVEVAKTRTQHFVGACVFAIGEDHYLFDVDRQELDHNIFNPFVTKLPKHVGTVAEAYDVLIPDEVRVALTQGTEVKRQGEFFFLKWSDECPVKSTLTEDEMRVVRFKPSRFGFGIAKTISTFDDSQKYPEGTELLTPAQQEFQAAAIAYEAVMEKCRSSIAAQGRLGKSASGSHRVEKFVKADDGTTFASGKISQDRRQHADLMLAGWWMVVANTGTFSWTIAGDID